MEYNRQQKTVTEHQRFNKALADLEANYHRDRASASARFQSKIRDIEARATQQRATALKSRSRSIQDIERNYARGLEDLGGLPIGDWSTQAEALRKDGEARQVKIEVNSHAHNRKLTELAQRRDRALEDLEIAHSRKLEDVERSRTLAREQAGNAHHQRMSQLEADYSFNSENAAMGHQVRLAAIEAGYDAASEKAATDHGNRLAAIETTHDAASEKAEADHGVRLAAIVAEWSADVSRIMTAGLQLPDAAVASAGASTPPTTKQDVDNAIADLDSGVGGLERPDVINLIKDYLWGDETAAAEGAIIKGPARVLAGEEGPEAIFPLPIDLSSLFTMPDFGHVMDAAQVPDIGEMVGASKSGDTYNIYGDVLDGEDFYNRTNEARLLQTRRGG